MYTAIKGVYENGRVVLAETPPTQQKADVVVMFLTGQSKAEGAFHRGVKMGGLAGKGYSIPDDFNAPLDDLREYM